MIPNLSEFYDGENRHWEILTYHAYYRIILLCTIGVQ
jgi:hypothetical protein